MDGYCDVIERRTERILVLFARDARVYRLTDSSTAEIVYRFDHYLAAMVHALRNGHATDPEATRIAREHGALRARQGFDVRGLIREFGVLRNAILDVVEQECVSMSVREFKQLAAFIGSGLVEAVSVLQAQRVALESAHAHGLGKSTRLSLVKK